MHIDLSILIKIHLQGIYLALNVTWGVYLKIFKQKKPNSTRKLCIPIWIVPLREALIYVY